MVAVQVMAGHFNCIGFPLETHEGFEKFMELAANSGTPIETVSGFYIHWAPGEGVEAWVQANPQRQLIGCNPHFSGQGRLRVGVGRKVLDPHAPLDGAIYGWAEPKPLSEAGQSPGMYPLQVNLPDFSVTAAALPMPSVVTMQIAAFAHQLLTFASDDEFAQPSNPLSKLATEAFIPSGLFRPDGQPVNPPRSEAMLTGHVLAASLLKNPVTQIEFYHLHIQSLSGTFDVVVAPKLVTGTAPVVGGVVAGTFWLSGRIVES
ncbi:MAG: hypothetical protein K2Y37_02310 [Pirellulales bacterium]|nr:hypothetical protein [Pirellulales bacterium]